MRLVPSFIVSAVAASALAAPVAKTDLPKLHLSIAVTDTKIEAIGDEAYRLTDDKIGELTVQIDNSPPKNEADEKTNVSALEPSHWHYEKLKDGLAVRFESSLGDGNVFFVQVFRKIGTGSYRCGTRAKSADQQSAAMAACKSLTKS